MKAVAMLIITVALVEEVNTVKEKLELTIDS